MPDPPKIIVLTMHMDPTLATQGFKADASGYVLKISPASEIVTAIQQALRERVYISYAVTGGVLGELTKSYEQGRSFASSATKQ
jgi:DNA-binding NarL/FixJ family response regulator